MSVIKVNPFLQGKTLSNILDDVFNRSISDIVGSDYAVTTPSVNISENDENFVMDIAAPGLDKNDFNIQVENDQLIISSAKSSDTEEKQEGKWTRKEFNFTSFKRSFHLSDKVNVDKIHAQYHHGILTLTLPKKDEVIAKGPKSISIN